MAEILDDGVHDGTLRAKFPPKLAPLFEPHRYKVLKGGRGGAKSWGVARALSILGFKRKIRWLCTREYQISIKDSVHWLMAEQIKRLGLDRFYDVQKDSIYGQNGTEFGFQGLHHNINNLKSWEGADGCWVEEAHTVSNGSWKVLIPTIRKDPANLFEGDFPSEIWISMNPEFEDDDTFVRFVEKPPTDTIIITINWRDNPWFPRILEKERQDCLRLYPDEYDHIWEGECLQWMEGAIYSKELKKLFLEERDCEVAHEPMMPVYTAWDLGRTDDTAIWWYQVVAGEIRVLECYASNGGSPSEYASEILGRKVQIDLVDNEVVAKLGPIIPELEYRRAYRYGKHFLPHDARAKTLAAHGKSIIEQLGVPLGLDNVAIVPDIGKEQGIQAARGMFHRLYFDKEKCAAGLKALRKYRREQKQDGISYSPQPKHDWTSHYADAFRMMAVAWQHERKSEAKPTFGEVIKRLSKPEARTLEQMYAERPLQKAARI